MPKKTSSFKRLTDPDSRERRLREWLGGDDDSMARTLYGLTLADIDGATPEEDELIAYGATKFAAEIAVLRQTEDAFADAYALMAREMWDRRVRDWIAAGHTHPDGSPSTTPNDSLIGHYPTINGRVCKAAHCDVNVRQRTNSLRPAAAVAPSSAVAAG